MKGVLDHVQPGVFHVSVDLTESGLLEAHVDGYIDLAREYVFGPVVDCTVAVDFHDPAVQPSKRSSEYMTRRLQHWRPKRSGATSMRARLHASSQPWRKWLFI